MTGRFEHFDARPGGSYPTSPRVRGHVGRAGSPPATVTLVGPSRWARGVGRLAFMRRVEKTRLTLEMLSPDQLIRAKPDPRLKLRTVSQSDPVLERLFREVGSPHLWSWESWSTDGAPPTKRNWLIQVDEEPAGLLTLLALPEGDVEMVTFGLLPRYQGRGLGGHAPTLATDLAWTTYGRPPSRVWLHTNNFDHPNALLNYLARGFVVVDRDVRTVSVPDGWRGPGAAVSAPLRHRPTFRQPVANG